MKPLSNQQQSNPADDDAKISVVAADKVSFLSSVYVMRFIVPAFEYSIAKFKFF